MRDLLIRFTRFGLLAFGGPVAQIAMLRRELVDEERWLDGPRFNRLLAVYQVLPGPEAHELAVHLGFLRGGRVGALLAGLGFMLPGFVLMLALAWLYFQVDLTSAAIGAALLGVQIAVVALVVRASERIGRHVLVEPGLWVVAIAAAAATIGGVPFWIVLPIGAAAFVVAGMTSKGVARLAIYGALVGSAVAALAVAAVYGQLSGLGSLGTSPVPGAATPTEATVPAIFLSGLKAGLLTFGGAYTAIPFIRGDAVGSGWLSDSQFLDGLALGGVLPAPLIIFGTFVGYVAGGFAGAVAMTLGIFIPAFAFAIVLGDRIEDVVDRPGLHRFLEGVAAGVVGIIVVTAVELGAVVVGRLPSILPGIAIFAVALVLVGRWRARLALPAVLALAVAAGWLAFFAFRS